MAAAAEGTFGEYRRFLAEHARPAAAPPPASTLATAHEPMAGAPSAAVAVAGGAGRSVARSRNDAGGVS
jgi:hypothetical protein